MAGMRTTCLSAMSCLDEGTDIRFACEIALRLLTTQAFRWLLADFGSEPAGMAGYDRSPHVRRAQICLLMAAAGS